MNIKTLTLLIIFSVLVGFLIFWLSNLFSKKPITNPVTLVKSITSTPAPTPIPTNLPIGPNDNLQEELQKLTPKDFTDDIQKLKEEASSF